MGKVVIKVNEGSPVRLKKAFCLHSMFPFYYYIKQMSQNEVFKKRNEPVHELSVDPVKRERV